MTAGYLLRFLRWHFYLDQMNIRVPAGANLRVFLASFLMSISPGKIGEAVKSYFLKVEFDVPATPTVAAFFCERFTDVLSMVLLSSAGFLLYPGGRWVILGIVVLQMTVLFLLQKPEWIHPLVFEPLQSWSRTDAWGHRAERFYRRSRELLSLKNLLVGTLLGFLSWGLEGICLGIVLRELGYTGVGFPVSVFVFCAAVLLGAAAMLPGGLGSSEALMVGMLLFFGIPRQGAAAATVLIRFVTLWYGVALGALAWVLTMRRIHRIETRDPPDK